MNMNYKQKCLEAEPTAKCELKALVEGSTKYYIINVSGYPQIAGSTAQMAWKMFYDVLKIKGKV